MSTGNEYTLVEQPFLDRLESMGWKHNTGNLDHPSASAGRASRPRGPSAWEPAAASRAPAARGR